MIEAEGNCTGNHDPKLAHLTDKKATSCLHRGLDTEYRS